MVDAVLFNVKVSEALMEMIDRATELSGAKSKSEWAREALEAGARAEIRNERRIVGLQRTGRPGGGFVRSQVATCSHPVAARIRREPDVICGWCGAVVRRL